MAWLAVSQSGNEIVSDEKPIRGEKLWAIEFDDSYYANIISLPKGTIEKIIGRKMTWEDEPVEIK